MRKESDKKENILVSACLLGVCCKYDGTSNEDKQVQALMQRANLIPVCAEIMGGLPTPRKPAERKGDRVLTEDGTDVTCQFMRGARELLKIAGLYGCRYAILKERSPSCGHGMIYDGTFSHTRIQGSGIAAQLLASHGIQIFGESMLAQLILLIE